MNLFFFLDFYKAFDTIEHVFLIEYFKVFSTHKLKKAVLYNSRAEGGLEVLNFIDTVNTFKMNWIKKCLANLVLYGFSSQNAFLIKLGASPLS